MDNRDKEAKAQVEKYGAEWDALHKGDAEETRPLFIIQRERDRADYVAQKATDVFEWADSDQDAAMHKMLAALQALDVDD